MYVGRSVGPNFLKKSQISLMTSSDPSLVPMTSRLVVVVVVEVVVVVVVVVVGKWGIKINGLCPLNL